MRLPTSFAIGTAVMLSVSAFAQDQKAQEPVPPGSKPTPAAKAASETTINLKVTGMT